MTEPRDTLAAAPTPPSNEATDGSQPRGAAANHPPAAPTPVTTVDTPCPTCGARPGDDCINREGDALVIPPHPKRQETEQEAWTVPGRPITTASTFALDDLDATRAELDEAKENAAYLSRRIDLANERYDGLRRRVEALIERAHQYGTGAQFVTIPELRAALDPPTLEMK